MQLGSPKLSALLLALVASACGPTDPSTDDETTRSAAAHPACALAPGQKASFDSRQSLCTSRPGWGGATHPITHGDGYLRIKLHAPGWSPNPRLEAGCDGSGTGGCAAMVRKELGPGDFRVKTCVKAGTSQLILDTGFRMSATSGGISPLPGGPYSVTVGFDRCPPGSTCTQGAGCVPWIVPGDTCANRLPLGPNATVSGNTANAGDDFRSPERGANGGDLAYSVDVPAAGALSLQLEADGFWGTTLLRPGCQTHAGDLPVEQTTGKVESRCVGPGNYTVVVDHLSKGVLEAFWAVASGPFTLSTRFTPCANCRRGSCTPVTSEREPNNAAPNATAVAAGAMVEGLLDGKDWDYYAVALRKDQTLKVSFAELPGTSPEAYVLTLFDRPPEDGVCGTAGQKDWDCRSATDRYPYRCSYFSANANDDYYLGGPALACTETHSNFAPRELTFKAPKDGLYYLRLDWYSSSVKKAPYRFEVAIN